MMIRSEPTYLGRAKNLMASGFALLAFVVALGVGTAGAPALGGVSWVMVTAGAAGLVYVAGAVIVTALVDVRTHSPRTLRPLTVTHLPDRRAR